MPLPQPSSRAIRWPLLGLLLLTGAPAAAQDAEDPDAAPPEVVEVPEAFALPWTDRPPRVDDGTVRAAAVGMPDERIGRFAARRASARTDGRERAMAALHAWADDALARVRATPREAQRVHAALERAAAVEAVRPLVDAGAVVVVRVPTSALRAACDREGLPW
ncbi:MAG TPA: hypothetical protein RMH99_10895 [Sandaracinaceae bacterium LLY-WYZ-13_1]|nr:hypothetical protein [Sandaracinaceae bacterium LLY-WYZ-13_1]